MNTIKSFSFFISLYLLMTAFAYADQHEETEHQAQTAIANAVSADIRTEKERARDESRKPLETLEFFGIEEDMRVIEIMPGGGWYTKILSQLLADKGELYVAVGAGRMDLEQPWLSKVKSTSTGYEFTRAEGSYAADLSPGDLGAKDVDMVLTFRNAHNLSEETRAMLHADVFAALAPGGVYGVIDHTKRHMEAFDQETRRRADPIKIIKEALDAGFIFEAYSDLHHRPEDKLIYDTRHESINTDSDRFTLKFRKPE